jgi:quercetin dioxygenase-like cupin family protein
MEAKPAVVHEDEREEEGWPEAEVAERGESVWRTLISGGLTPSERLTVGVARLPGGGTLPAHHHEQAEVYYVLEGTGLVTLDGAAHRLRPGAAVFIPGGAVHAVEADGPSDLRVLYVLAADSFEDVTYVFAGSADRA